MDYLNKMRGCRKNDFRLSYREAAWSFAGAFFGISAVAYIHYVLLNASDAVMLIGSFGASAVLLYGAPQAPLSQPRNLLGGHVISAVTGVFFASLLGGIPWLACGMAVASAIALMHITGTLHPPGGATALIAVIGSPDIHALGYVYALVPALLGAVVLLVVALLVNNASSTRQYPLYWF